MSTNSIIVRDEVRVSRIAKEAGISAILAIGSKFKYESAPSFNDPNDIPNKAYIDNFIFALIPEIHNITIGSSSPNTYAYSGIFGTRPTAYAVQDMGGGVFRNRPDIMIDVNTNFNILAYGDFSADQIQIVIKP